MAHGSAMDHLGYTVHMLTLSPAIRKFLNIGHDRDAVLLLRTTALDGSAYGGFRWPTTAGVGVVAPDWDPAPVCGGGLHGALWGQGDAVHLARHGNWTGLWSVVVARGADVVDLGGKVKVPRAWVAHVGDQASATEYVYTRSPTSAVIGVTLTGGDDSTLTWRVWDGMVWRLYTVYIGEGFGHPGVAYTCRGGTVNVTVDAEAQAREYAWVKGRV